ncbi:hypothetical protein ACQ4PT_041953 [Festuca glaucescens]
MAKAAAAFLPGLLPTPPMSTIVPCLIIPPFSFKPSRADSVERWDAHKTDTRPGSPSSTCGSSSPGRVSSCERWDDSNKRAPSRTSSANRWDIHKKPRSAQADAESRTCEQEKQEIGDKQPQEDETTAPAMEPVFSGSSFFASPEPSMLPMPTFFRSRCPSMMPVPAH